MRLTIVVPAYNEEKLLGKCLEAIQNQNEKADEVIVVNNNSKDRTEEVAKKYGVTLINEPKQGLSFARNTGFNTATGDIMGRIDADTIIPKDWTTNLKKNFSDPDVVGVTGPVHFYDFYGGRYIKKILGWIHTRLFFKIGSLALGHDVLFGSNHAIRKSAWEKIKNSVCTNDKIYHEDVDLTAHISQIGKIVFDPQLISDISSRRVKSFLTLFDYAVREFRVLKHARSLKAPQNTA